MNTTAESVCVIVSGKVHTSDDMHCTEEKHPVDESTFKAHIPSSLNA
jgi:hypothetical protein